MGPHGGISDRRPRGLSGGAGKGVGGDCKCILGARPAGEVLPWSVGGERDILVWSDTQGVLAS